MNICIPLAQGFEEIEAVSMIDILRRAGFTVVVAGLESKYVEGSHGIKIEVDVILSELSVDSLDLILLPGGLPGALNLANNDKLRDMLKEMDAKDKYIGAICAAPFVLKKAGLIKSKYTAYPSWEEKIDLKKYSQDKVVFDKNIITSKGPGTAMCFALELVKYFLGDGTYQQLKKELLVDFC